MVPDQEVVVSLNQAQVDAVEHLLMAFLKRSESAQIVAKVYEDAYASIMGSEGPPDNAEKEAALEHLNNLRLQLK
ncbi:hypothetical protein DM813_19335 [Pseudomonas alkylphenolica]|uniref:Uncharacterized protein n=1 Tax=Pseudomonas alkylphenolica TaxID=237609 RepID=A0A443ZQG6_9PSED|nr:hypothetical protein [Pseudomonas alkylphenolica]RWU21338.1 hypothetical protein DM813_19335 [Pseudomonas alkylphenolica]